MGSLHWPWVLPYFLAVCRKHWRVLGDGFWLDEIYLRRTPLVGKRCRLVFRRHWDSFLNRAPWLWSALSFVKTQHCIDLSQWWTKDMYSRCSHVLCCGPWVDWSLVLNLALAPARRQGPEILDLVPSSSDLMWARTCQKAEPSRANLALETCSAQTHFIMCSECTKDFEERIYYIHEADKMKHNVESFWSPLPKDVAVYCPCIRDCISMLFIVLITNGSCK